MESCSAPACSLSFAHLPQKKCSPKALGSICREILGEIRQLTFLMDNRDDLVVQVLHDGHNHWVCISNIGCKVSEVNYYDSMFTGSLKPCVKKQIASLVYGTGPKITVHVKPVQQQRNGSDCGPFSLAFATSLEPSQSLYLLSCTVCVVCHGIILIKPILITIWPSVTNAPVGFTGNVPKFQMKSLRRKQAGIAVYVLFDCFMYKNY